MSSSPKLRPNYMESQQAQLSSAALLLYAVICGSAVATVYYSQPLLDAIALEFGINSTSIGTVVTVTQICYAFGLFFLVPLGDLLDPRRLVTGMLVFIAIALSIVALASNTLFLFIGMGMVGFQAVVAQILVALAANRASLHSRGRAIGVVTSGIVIGILLGRTFSGTLADLAGWRSVYIVTAVIMICMAYLFLTITPAARRPPSLNTYGGMLSSMKDLFVQVPLLRIRGLLAFFIFSDFSILWSSMVLPMSSPPLSFSHSVIGLFGLAGAAGALAASSAGRLADRGLGQRTTGIALLLLLFSWLPIGLLQHSMWLYIIGVVMLDFAVQAVHVTNQSMILSVRPEARSRLTAGYMIFYSFGSATGAAVSTWIYSWAGWFGVCILGTLVSMIAVFFWACTLKRSYRSTNAQQ
ncbi:MFS transporter [Paenibacillus mucilaginosus]|uniref:MFS transporter n=1 Tax=Paenibacillus mucilaginosus TaxID=61624 RepID=UPI00240D6815|nr:MFS transporter [Paenibacillus mucilaginosus]WFA20173.1 MFS transporter [Paenibacillus mucilaginosus]